MPAEREDAPHVYGFEDALRDDEREAAAEALARSGERVGARERRPGRGGKRWSAFEGESMRWQDLFKGTERG